MKSHVLRTLLFTGSASLAIPSLLADPFTNIRIGDKDGFGFSAATVPLLYRATPTHTTLADTNGNALLEQGEYLPDLNKNGSVATGSGDDFDNRAANEKSDSLIQGSGFTSSVGTLGSKWTDISLSTSFTGPNFPDSLGAGAPNEPIFNFRFSVNNSDIVTGSTLFFNLIFGDYDVTPASVKVTKNNGSGGAGVTSTVNLTLQGGGQDGLVQAAFLNLGFYDVFSSAGTSWTGYLDVKFEAPNEPYTAFDYAELSLDQIPFTTPDSGGTLCMLGTGMVLLAATSRRFRRK